MTDITTRIESESEVNSYLQNLRYALEHNARITFQLERIVDRSRNKRFTTNPCRKARVFRHGMNGTFSFSDYFLY